MPDKFRVVYLKQVRDAVIALYERAEELGRVLHERRRRCQFRRQRYCALASCARHGRDRDVRQLPRRTHRAACAAGLRSLGGHRHWHGERSMATHAITEAPEIGHLTSVPAAGGKQKRELNRSPKSVVDAGTDLRRQYSDPDVSWMGRPYRPHRRAAWHFRSRTSPYLFFAIPSL